MSIQSFLKNRRDRINQRARDKREEELKKLGVKDTGIRDTQGNIVTDSGSVSFDRSGDATFKPSPPPVVHHGGGGGSSGGGYSYVDTSTGKGYEVSPEGIQKEVPFAIANNQQQKNVQNAMKIEQFDSAGNLEGTTYYRGNRNYLKRENPYQKEVARTGYGMDEGTFQSNLTPGQKLIFQYTGADYEENTEITDKLISQSFKSPKTKKGNEKSVDNDNSYGSDYNPFNDTWSVQSLRGGKRSNANINTVHPTPDTANFWKGLKNQEEREAYLSRDFLIKELPQQAILGIENIFVKSGKGVADTGLYLIDLGGELGNLVTKGKKTKWSDYIPSDVLSPKTKEFLGYNFREENPWKNTNIQNLAMLDATILGFKGAGALGPAYERTLFAGFVGYSGYETSKNPTGGNVAMTGLATLGLAKSTKEFIEIKALKKAETVPYNELVAEKVKPFTRQRATLLLKDEEGKYIFGETKQGQTISIGGGIEKGQTPRQATLKELYQETGLKLKDINNLNYKGSVVTPEETFEVFTADLKKGSFEKIKPSSDINKIKLIDIDDALGIEGQSYKYPIEKKITSVDYPKFDLLNIEKNMFSPNVNKARARIYDLSLINFAETGKKPNWLKVDTELGEYYLGTQSRYNVPYKSQKRYLKEDNLLLAHGTTNPPKFSSGLIDFDEKFLSQKKDPYFKKVKIVKRIWSFDLPEGTEILGQFQPYNDYILLKKEQESLFQTFLHEKTHKKINEFKKSKEQLLLPFSNKEEKLIAKEINSKPIQEWYKNEGYTKREIPEEIVADYSSAYYSTPKNKRIELIKTFPTLSKVLYENFEKGKLGFKEDELLKIKKLGEIGDIPKVNRNRKIVTDLMKEDNLNFFKVEGGKNVRGTSKGLFVQPPIYPGKLPPTDFMESFLRKGEKIFLKERSTGEKGLLGNKPGTFKKFTKPKEAGYLGLSYAGFGGDSAELDLGITFIKQKRTFFILKEGAKGGKISPTLKTFTGAESELIINPGEYLKAKGRPQKFNIGNEKVYFQKLEIIKDFDDAEYINKQLKILDTGNKASKVKALSKLDEITGVDYSSRINAKKRYIDPFKELSKSSKLSISERELESIDADSYSPPKSSRNVSLSVSEVTRSQLRKSRASSNSRSSRSQIYLDISDDLSFINEIEKYNPIPSRSRSPTPRRRNYYYPKITESDIYTPVPPRKKTYPTFGRKKGRKQFNEEDLNSIDDVAISQDFTSKILGFKPKKIKIQDFYKELRKQPIFGLRKGVKLINGRSKIPTKTIHRRIAGKE